MKAESLSSIYLYNFLKPFDIYGPGQVWIQPLKEISQTDLVLVLPLRGVEI